MNINNKNVLVSGAAGFIGSHLVNGLLARNATVFALDSLVGGNINNVSKDVEKFYKYDIKDFNLCKEVTKDIDIVFHCAAHASEGQSVYCPIYNAQTNILGSLNLLVASINNNVEKFGFTSSIAAYGNPIQLPIKENHPLVPEDPYGISKLTFENYLRIYYELGVIKPFIIRFYNVYGPRLRMNDPYRGVVTIFINRCLKGLPPVIFGDGEQARAFTFITDIIDAFIDASLCEKVIGVPLNIGAENPITINSLAKMIIEKIGINLKPIYVPARESDVKVTYSDVSLARKLLGFKPKVDISEGLDKTIEWSKSQGPQEFKYQDICEIDKLAHDVYKKKII